jgi:hypothetical protein
MKMCYTWEKEMIMDLKIARRKYHTHKGGALNRGIEWLFTFDSWIKKWEESGKWEQRGHKKGQYCMSRPNDQGPYSPDNVIIKTHQENVIEAKQGKKRGPQSAEWRANNAKANAGRKATNEHRLNISNGVALWHQKRKEQQVGYDSP